MSNVTFAKRLEESYPRIIYQLLNDKLFTALGLELSSINVYFDNNQTFTLKDYTFGYFNPIENAIHVNVDHPFFSKHENDLYPLVFILFHEAYHKILLHTDRAGDKEHMLWNCAADYEIHNILKMYCESDCLSNNYMLSSSMRKIHEILERSDNAEYKPTEESGEIKPLFSNKFLDYTAEEIYGILKSSKTQESEEIEMDLSQLMGNGNCPGNGNGNCPGNIKVKITKTEIKLPNGETIKNVSIEWPKNEELPSELRKTDDQLQNERMSEKLKNQVFSKETQEVFSRQAGKGNAKINKFLNKLFKIKIDWEKMLRASIQNVCSKTDYFTWARPRTTSMTMDMYMPAIAEETEKYGTLILARDESGSMSDDDIVKSIQVLREAKEYYKQIVVLKHCENIIAEYKIEDLDDEAERIICTREGYGGTSHRDIFKYISDYTKNNQYDEDNISCVIMITDCESDIQQYQDTISSNIPIIYLTNENARTEGIKGKIIKIGM